MGERSPVRRSGRRARRPRGAGWRRGPRGSRAARRRRGRRAGERCSSVSRSGTPCPRRAGRCTSPAGRARGARARSARPSAAGRWRRGAAAAPRARPEPPLSGCAATTRPITIAGSRSSRSATRRTRSSRLALSPIAGQDRRHLAEGPVALGRRGDVGAVEDQADLEGGQLDRAVEQGAKALGAALCGHHLGRVLPGRHRRDPQPHLAPGGDPLRPQHRLLPGGVGVERQDHLLDHPRERGDLLRR